MYNSAERHSSYDALIFIEFKLTLKNESQAPLKEFQLSWKPAHEIHGALYLASLLMAFA
jgi:hypothetical protein